MNSDRGTDMTQIKSIRGIVGKLPEKKDTIVRKGKPTIEELEEILNAKGYEVLPNGELIVKDYKAIGRNETIDEIRNTDINLEDIVEVDVERIGVIIEATILVHEKSGIKYSLTPKVIAQAIADEKPFKVKE